MLKIADQICYTGFELVERLGPPFTLKRIEHLRTLGLVPRPIKVGTGNGTIGHYSEQVVSLLREIERKHSEEKSYPDLVPVMRDKVATIEYKMQELKDDYKTKKAIRRAEIAFGLIADKRRGTGIKPPNNAKLDGMSKEFCDEILELRAELKRLFGQKDNLRMDVLLKIKKTIERLRSLESVKAASDNAHTILMSRVKA